MPCTATDSCLRARVLGEAEAEGDSTLPPPLLLRDCVTAKLLLKFMLLLAASEEARVGASELTLVSDGACASGGADDETPPDCGCCVSEPRDSSE